MMRTLAAFMLLLIGIAGCRRPPAHAIEDLRGEQDLSRFSLSRLYGTRDGDSLQSRALYTDGNGGEVRVELHFKVGVPTRLEAGTWHGLGSQGQVAERSVTFLGGQSSAPSLGGRFHLLGPDSSARYLITIPLQPLTQPF